MPAFILGVNYPWVACGHDFGPRPPAWAGAPPTDWPSVQRELERLRGLGLSVVRFWLLAGGVNYPVGRDPDEVAARVPFGAPFTRRDDARRFALRGDPPPLPQAFLDDYARLLDAGRAAGVRLLPSLLSFELFRPITPHRGGPMSGGRGDFVLGRNQRAFFDRVLEPLLEVSVARRDALFAFEVMNEPDWIALGTPRGPFVDPRLLTAFLAEGAARIASRDLLSTIGFCHARPTWLTPDAHDALARLAERGAYLHQRHFYPREELGMRLPPARESAIEPCLLGELPTAQAGRWADPELWATESDPERHLEARLALAETRGYAGALVWARRAEDAQTRWDAGIEAQLRRAAQRSS